VDPASGRAILPLVNATFNNQYYDASSTFGTAYMNVVKFIAESNGVVGQAYAVQFTSVFGVVNVDYQVAYSSQMSAFTLAKRWSSYHDSSSSAALAPNANFPFFTLQNPASSPTTGALDARVVFSAPPKLEISENVFFELPFDGNQFNITGAVVPQRGNSFFVATIPLDSSQDFKMKMTLGSVPLTASSSSSATAFSIMSGSGYGTLPSGSSLSVGLAYDFTQSANYSGSTHPLLYPLKPVCYELKNQNYLPWDALLGEGARDLSIAQGQPFVVCDLDQTAELTPSTAPPATAASIDTWFSFFSYAPYRPANNELGHLFGIESVTFSMTACLKVQVKAPSDPDAEWTAAAGGWKTASAGAAGGVGCGLAQSNADNTWTAVVAQQSFSIFDNVAPYAGAQGLVTILNQFKNSSVTPYQSMKINNEKLSGTSVRHLY
jgi:hypothetical protein